MSCVFAHIVSGAGLALKTDERISFFESWQMSIEVGIFTLWLAALRPHTHTMEFYRKLTNRNNRAFAQAISRNPKLKKKKPESEIIRS